VAQTKATVKTTVIKNEEGIVTRCEIHNGKHKKFNKYSQTTCICLFNMLFFVF